MELYLLSAVVLDMREHFNQTDSNLKTNPFWQDGTSLEVVYTKFNKWNVLLDEGYTQEQLEKYFKQWLKWKYPECMKKYGVVFQP